MKKTYLLLSLAAGLAFSVAVKAQTAEEIVNKHIEAIGGKEKLASLQNIYTEGTISAVGNAYFKGVSKIYRVNGKGLREDMQFHNSTVTTCFSDKQGWSFNPFLQQKAAAPLGPDESSAGRAELPIGGPLLNYAANGGSVELLDKEDVNGVNAWKIQLLTKDSSEFTYLIDPTTFYILKRTVTSSTGEPIESDQYSDYRKTDAGYVMPFAIEITKGHSGAFDILIKKVDINQDIDPTIFDLPK